QRDPPPWCRASASGARTRRAHGAAAMGVAAAPNLLTDGGRLMDLTRRDLIKLGALGSAALVLPLERTARSALQQANRLDPRSFPAVGQLPFRVPPTARPTPMMVTVPGAWIDPAHPMGNDPVEIEVDYYSSHMQQTRVPIMPGLPPTWIWGYQGSIPAATFHVERGRP